MSSSRENSHDLFGPVSREDAKAGRKVSRLADSGKPDPVLMDIILEGKRDGIEAAEEIRRRFNIPVVFVTAHGEEAFLERAKKAEPFGYVLKPFSRETLSATIEVALYKYRIEQKLKESEENSKNRVLELQDAKYRIETQAAKISAIADQLALARDEALAASRAKTFFLTNMSHELRTPLNAILGFSEMMRMEMLGAIGVPAYVGYAADIHSAGKHLLQVINDLLDISKVEAGAQELKEEELDVRKEILSSLDFVREHAQTHGVLLSANIPDGFPNLFADRLRLKQILLNLLTNAVKFTPEEGSVIVEAALNRDNAVLLRVIDTGVGIAPEDIPKVFLPFGQIDDIMVREQEGTGLGVPLTKALAELHGGALEITSEAGVGTTVTVRFPPARTKKY